MSAYLRHPVRYVGLENAPHGGFSTADLFDAMMDDLLRDGNVDLAMQKAFRWGFEANDGHHHPGLRDIMQRLREDQQETLERADSSGAQARGEGDETVELDDDTGAEDDADLVQLAGKLDRMERSLRAIERLEDIAGLDPDLVDNVLTDAERSWLDRWANMQGTLLGEGMVIEVGHRLELTPRAVRRIGEHVLRTIFTAVDEPRGGGHEMQRRGRVGAQAETSAPWQFGDPFSLNLPRSIMNSLMRRGPAGRMMLTPEDFEVYERESRGSVATVLLIDMSRSMFYNGCWDAAKRSALALDTLMRGQFPRDDLEIAGFSERAQRLTLTQLPSLEWNEYSHGTNLEDGLRLARELLRPFTGKTRQIVLITDGEPTAYLDGDAVRFEHPPTGNVFDATLREVVRCTRENIRINTFLLTESTTMAGFAERYSRLNRGRLIHVDPGNLGRFLLRDFLRHRSALVR